MKKEIESLIEGFNLESFDPQNIEEVTDVVIKIMESKSQNEYFEIMNRYVSQKKALRMSTSDVSRSSGVPLFTVRRFENLHSCPNVLTLMNMLRAVGLKITLMPVENE